MQRLGEIVKLYLQMETTYALMITGEWGVGKTYYYKNTLEKIIEDTSTFNNQAKKYQSIRISLFGIKSIEDIQSEIFLAVYPILTSKAVKFGGVAARLLVKGFMQLKGAGKVEDYLDTGFNKKDTIDFISFDDLVICFDDLERISDNLKIEELIGYINSLVENENIKVLIIANENIIQQEKYGQLKEKVVGNSIEFNSGIMETFDDLVTTKFHAFSSYASFLITNKEDVLRTFSPESNLRILIFALTHFQQVYSALNINIIDEPVLDARKDEILLKLLKFTLAISIEYKKHKLSFKKRREIDSNDYRGLYNALKQQGIKNKQEKSYKDEFLDRYYNDGSYYFFNSIYDFITGGNTFKYDDLILELKKIFYIEDKKVLPQYALFESLKYPQVFNLSDNEYKSRTKQMLNYVDNGLYDYDTYITAFHFAIRLGNPFGYNSKQLVNRIIRGMDKGRASYKYINSLDYHLTLHPDDENLESLRGIKDAALNINSSLGEEKSMIQGKDFEKLFYSDYKQFTNRFFDQTNGFMHEPILMHFDPNKLYSHFLKSPNSRRWEIISFFKSRYRNHQDLQSEIPFLVALDKKLDKKVESMKDGKPSSFLFRELHAKVKSSVETLQARPS